MIGANSPAPDPPTPRRAGRAFAAVLDLAVTGAAASSITYLAGSVLESPPLAVAVVAAVVLAVVRTYRWVLERRILDERRAVVDAADHEVSRAKDQFLANVSHGLRTPLTGIVGFAQILRGSLPAGEDREAVEMIIGESAELSRIVDDLLMATRLDAGVLEISPEDVPVTDQIGQVVDFMDLLDAPVHVDCVEATITVDPERFRQVIRNLVVNAHRHGRPSVAITGRVQHGRYICDVIDHGPGVPADLHRSLFSRFSYRSDGSVNGHVGLGLAIVEQLSSLMGLEVSYRRVRGETHFVVSVPLAENQETGAGGRLTRHPQQLVRHDDRLVTLPA